MWTCESIYFRGGDISGPCAICESCGMVPDVWWGNDHDPNKNDVDFAGKHAMKALNQIMDFPNFWRIHKQFMFLEKRSVVARVFVGDMSTTVVNPPINVSMMFQFSFWPSTKNVHTKKSGDLLVFWCKNYSCSSSPSWPVTGGIPPMPHRLPKEQTAAIIAVGSIGTVEKVLARECRTSVWKTQFCKGSSSFVMDYLLIKSL